MVSRSERTCDIDRASIDSVNKSLWKIQEIQSDLTLTGLIDYSLTKLSKVPSR
jgi:hypothetical protein